MQLRLQRELFAPNNEQLLSMVHCVSEKDKNKTKDIFVCLVNETDRFSVPGQFNINIVEAKGSDKRGELIIVELIFKIVDLIALLYPQGELPKRKRNWTIHELRNVDGKHEDTNADHLDIGEFELGFSNDKKYAYKAVNYEEKKRFLSTLIRLADQVSSAGQSRKVSVANLPPDLVLEDTKSKTAALPSEARSGDSQEEAKDSWPMMGKDEADEAYQAISDREAADLMTLMKSCDHAITNADLFVEDLSRQLNILDGDNIYSIMASEESINHLMSLLEGSIKHAETLESRLVSWSFYFCLLQN